MDDCLVGNVIVTKLTRAIRAPIISLDNAIRTLLLISRPQSVSQCICIAVAERRCI